MVDFDWLYWKLIEEGEIERDAAERDLARLRIFVLLYLIDGEAAEEAAAAARTVLFDRVIIPI